MPEEVLTADQVANELKVISGGSISGYKKGNSWPLI